jgi:hypothetical protein
VSANAEPVTLDGPDRFITPTPSTTLQRLVDDGAVYIPQALNHSQFTTLLVLLNRTLPSPEANPARLAARLDTAVANTAARHLPLTAPPLLTFDYVLALDELDTIARTCTGFAFAALTPEIQDAMLGLIATKDLTTRKLDLALWLNDLRRHAASALALPS